MPWQCGPPPTHTHPTPPIPHPPHAHHFNKPQDQHTQRVYTAALTAGHVAHVDGRRAQPPHALRAGRELLEQVHVGGPALVVLIPKPGHLRRRVVRVGGGAVRRMGWGWECAQTGVATGGEWAQACSAPALQSPMRCTRAPAQEQSVRLWLSTSPSVLSLRALRTCARHAHPPATNPAPPHYVPAFKCPPPPLHMRAPQHTSGPETKDPEHIPSATAPPRASG